MEKNGYVYILSSHSRTLYIGITSDLAGRLYEHKNKIYRGFTADYRIDQLVYFETYPEITDAIDREKQIKNGGARKKLR